MQPLRTGEALKDLERRIWAGERPPCALCAKPVDRMIVVPRMGHQLELLVECHGESEVQSVPTDELFCATSRIEFAPCFSVRRLQDVGCAVHRAERR